MQVDFLIVGQGIAGTLLAEELLKRKKKILVADYFHSGSSSMIAAGLYNPVVFKRFAKSWRADEMIPFAAKVYSTLEKKLKSGFHYKKTIIKVFSSENEYSLWENKRRENSFMSPAKKGSPDLKKVIHAPFGYGEVYESGYVDIELLINLYKEFLVSHNLLINEKVNYRDILIEKDCVNWKKIRADKIIFCEGHQAVANPFFNWLPFKLTKGELLTVEINNLESENIINKGVFILPVGKNKFRIGATYKWDELSEKTTVEGKKELTEKLEKLLNNIPYRILKQEAGIRPTVLDRRPFLGEHPEHKRLFIFNGMGTKGVLLAPYFAAHFADFLTGKITAIDADAGIERIRKNKI